MTFIQSPTFSMWNYQHYFRRNIKSLMNNVLEELGITEFKAECLVVGTKIPPRQNPNNVCVEPENGKWDIHLFDDLLNLIEMEINKRPQRSPSYSNIAYTISEESLEWIDETAIMDKPENIYRRPVRLAVQKSMRAYDSEHGVQSFAGEPALVDEHYVTPVLQLPSALFEHFRPLRESVINDGRFTGHASLIHAAVSEVLAKAHDELLGPHPGRFGTMSVMSSSDIIRHAALSFMRTLGIIIRDNNSLQDHIGFEKLNGISSLMYEKTKGVGQLLLVKSEDETVNFVIKFTQPIPFDDQRWSRKVLQLASSGTPLIANYQEILGLGHVAAGIDPWEGTYLPKCRNAGKPLQ